MITGLTFSTPRRSPRTFDSPTEAVRDLADVARRGSRLAAAYGPGGLDPRLRERVMVAVSRVAVAYAVALTEARFREPIPSGFAAAAAEHLDAHERAKVETVAQAMAMVNLFANTAEELVGRVRSRAPLFLSRRNPPRGVTK